MVKLKFGLGNSKLAGFIATFSLPAGHTCPFAEKCLAKTDRITGKLTDGPNTEFRCFSATGECRAPTVRNARWFNYELLQTTYKKGGIQAVTNLIHNSLPEGAIVVRLHVAGDFFAEWYLKAWINVALANPNTIFYTYTKSIGYWVKNRKSLPNNLRLVGSLGGKQDHLISKHNLVSAQVVFSEEQAKELGLPIDHDDSLARAGTKPFALLLHATQKAGTPAAEAWKMIKKTVGGYNPNKKRNTQPIENVPVLVS